MSILLQKLKRKLEKVEKELEKVRGCSPLTDGWQTQRYAKKSRKWDMLAKEKHELLIKIEDEELKYGDGIWLKTSDCLPPYYEVVFIELSSGERHQAWRSSNGENDIWTKFGTNIILDNVDFFMRFIVSAKRLKRSGLDNRLNKKA